MVLKIKFGLVILVSVLLLQFGLSKNIQKKVNVTIVSTFNIEFFELNVVEISSEVINKLPSTFNAKQLFKIKNNDTLLGFAYVSKAPSKTDRFDYLVLFDANLIIMKSKVLIYRENYGGEIGSKRWLKQFKGKTVDDDLIYGDNIVAISGATISVKSMTLAVNNVLKSIKILQKNQVL